MTGSDLVHVVLKADAASVYLAVSILSYVVLKLLYWKRWSGSECPVPVVILSAVWPLTMIFVYGLVVEEEQRRRDVIAREVMES